MVVILCLYLFYQNYCLNIEKELFHKQEMRTIILYSEPVPSEGMQITAGVGILL